MAGVGGGRRPLETWKSFEAPSARDEHIVSHFVLPHVIGQGEYVSVLRMENY